MTSDGKLEIRARTFVAVLVVAVLVGLGVSGLWSHPPEGERAATPIRNSAVDRSRSRLGATRAATGYVRLGQELFDRGPAEREDFLRQIAADEAADGFVAAQSRQLAELDGIAARGDGPLTWDVAVLGTRTEAFTDQRARVSVWRVGILSIKGLAAPLAEWTTVTYELVWEHHGWRIWSESQVPGPTPLGHPEETPSTPAEFTDSMRGFVRYPNGGPL